MGQLLVVRHGQESMMRTNFDDLSEQGREQATALGEHLAGHGWGIDLVYSGPALRHRDTARRVGKAVVEAGHAWPEPMELPGLDELDELSLVRASVGSLSDDAEVVGLRREMLEVRGREG
jgi:broad specificity phosphatase PhoE